MAKLSLNLLEFGFKLRYFAKPDAYYQSPFYQEYYPIALNTVNAIGHIQRQEYGIFLLNLAQILQPIIEDKIRQDDSDKNEYLNKFIKDFLFYGGFMVDILTAKEAADVSAIIQQYALPIGSYRMKRHANFLDGHQCFSGFVYGDGIRLK